MKLVERKVGENGIETNDYIDPNGGMHVHRVQDIAPVLNANKAEYNSHGDLKSSRYGKGPMHKIASIPMIVVEKWLKEGFDIYTATPQQIRRKLNDPEYKYLRTMPGKL